MLVVVLTLTEVEVDVAFWDEVLVAEEVLVVVALLVEVLLDVGSEAVDVCWELVVVLELL